MQKRILMGWLMNTSLILGGILIILIIRRLLDKDDYDIIEDAKSNKGIWGKCCSKIKNIFGGGA